MHVGLSCLLSVFSLRNESGKCRVKQRLDVKKINAEKNQPCSHSFPHCVDTLNLSKHYSVYLCILKRTSSRKFVMGLSVWQSNGRHVFKNISSFFAVQFLLAGGRNTHASPLNNCLKGIVRRKTKILSFIYTHIIQNQM